MPSLTDLFNPTVLIFLGILMLAVALLVVYFESRMREQTHKIASMLSLVSSLAEELNGVKFGLNHLSMRGGVMFQPNHLAQNENNNVENSLIAVSDDDDEEHDDDDDDDDHDDDDFDEESVSSEETNHDSSDEDSIANEDVKVLKLNISSNVDDNRVIDNFETVELNDDTQSLSSKTSALSIKESYEILASQIDTEENKDETNIISQREFKTININLEEQLDSLDYKKLQLTKLRSIVTEKGLSTDSSKLKKNELLKLLGVE